MRLLVLTQAVDSHDRALGFFIGWLRAFSAHADLEVVCLKEGTHQLPSSVHVHSLGKERGVSRLTYLFRLYKYIFTIKYDTVFVHMNEEYVLLCGWWWRLRGKKIVLWRNHKKGTWRTTLAVLLSDTVCYTSPDAYIAKFKNALKMPIGIDTEIFKPAEIPTPNSLLFLGRLDPVKKVEVFIEALNFLEVSFAANLYGSPTKSDSIYAKEILQKAQDVKNLAVHPGVDFKETPALYASHAVYVNLTPSGSFDKTIGEAMASGCVVVCANAAVKDTICPELFVETLDGSSVARAISAAIALTPQERQKERDALRTYIVKEHSLAALVESLLPQF